MGKRARAEARKESYGNRLEFIPGNLHYHPEIKKFAPKSSKQADYYRLLESNKITFGVGPAGTGKTFVPVHLALTMLTDREISKIYIVRPVIEAGESIGTLPGGVDEKLQPYFHPIVDNIQNVVSKDPDFERIMERVEIAPLAFMRGRTLDNAFIILDEAQNTTPSQMRMFLTRIGDNAKVAITGDITQRDIRGEDGLSAAIKRLRGIEDIGFASFKSSDVIRSKIVKDIIAKWPE